MKFSDCKKYTSNQKKPERRIHNDPQCHVKNFYLYMIYVEEKVKKKIHIITMCMCITYRISFVCGLTNPSEKERINNNQCAQNVSTKPPMVEVDHGQSLYCKDVAKS